MSKKDYVVVGGLIALAAGWRLVNYHFGVAPNLEIVTAMSALAALVYGRNFAITVPLLAMALSDAVIGNTPILLFTWSAFALIGASALLLRRVKPKPVPLALGSAGFAFLSSTFFFLYTNFGVWLQSNGTFYAFTPKGLLDCYIMGLPFYRTMLIGNLIIIPTVVTAWYFVKTRRPSTAKRALMTP